MSENDMIGFRHEERPDYGGIRGDARFATQPFETADELDESGVDESTDVESNELHGAAGEVCARCGRPLDARVEIRRTAAGTYVHEWCPG